MAWWERIDDAVSELGSVSRAAAKLILSLLMLGVTAGLVFALYKGVLYAMAHKPWWMKILGI